MENEFENENQTSGDYTSQGSTGDYNGQNSYANNQYNYGTYGSDGMTNQYGTYTQQGNTPVDSNGQPLKNRFGMKLTFSILEMLSLLSCNIVTFILGIVSCVFTSKANKAFKEGRWDDFKSSKKTSMITLWVGFGIGMLYLISIIVVIVVGVAALPAMLPEDLQDVYWDAYNEAYYGTTNGVDDYNTDVETPDTDKNTDTDNSVSVPVTAGSGFVDPTITLNGVTISMPMAYSEFVVATGLSMEDSDATYVLDGEDYEIVNLYNGQDDTVYSAWIMNFSESQMAMADCNVVGIIAYDYGYEDQGTIDMIIQNGITFASSQDDVKTALGEPDTASSSTTDGVTYEYWTWPYASENASYFDEIEIDFINGAIYSIEVSNTTM